MAISTGSTIFVIITITSLFISWIAVVFQILFVVAVFRRDHRFLRYMQISMLISLISSIILIIGIPTMLIGVVDAYIIGVAMLGVYAVFGMSLCFSVGYALLMILYYCKSERVRIYMGGEEFKDKALFAFR